MVESLFNFQKYKFAIRSHHIISFVSAGGKSRSAAEFLLMVYHLQESLRLRRIYLAQIKLAAFHQRIFRRHGEPRHNSSRVYHSQQVLYSLQIIFHSAQTKLSAIHRVFLAGTEKYNLTVLDNKKRKHDENHTSFFYLLTTTLVPKGMLSCNHLASGIDRRMQPCEAGWPNF